MKILSAYSNRSCVTGKALKQKLNALRKKSDRLARCDLFLRWGSTQEFTKLQFKHQLNSLEAVSQTANKLRMLIALKWAGIPVPEFDTDPELVQDFKDDSGKLYVRSKEGIVRYAESYLPSLDLYYTKPIKDKRREYRVHVFNGKILGIYEKVPFDSENRPALYKSDTCRFIKSDPDISRVNLEAQATCIKAVQALGLVHGGVDLIRDRHGNFFIVEVNSAPGLNSIMLERYVYEIREYVNNLSVLL